MTSNMKVVVDQNPYNGSWEVGWRSADGTFTPQYCGYATRQKAEAQLFGFDERLKTEMQAFMAEMEANAHAEAEQFPNLGRTRAKISDLYDSKTGKGFAESFDASNKLAELLAMDLHEHIDWPLPSWKAIKSGRVYGR